MAKPGRNEPCPCGSGKKFKNCCVDRGGIYEERSGSTPRFVNRADDLKRATLAFIDDCSRTLGISSNAIGTSGRLPSRIHADAIREVYQRLPQYFPHGSAHTSLLKDLAARSSSGVYFGPSRPQTVLSHITRHSLYNEHLVVPNPFCDLMMYQPEASPLVKPDSWRQVAVNQTLYLLVLKPWIEADIVTCLPPLRWFDPVFFDGNLVPLAEARLSNLTDTEQKQLMAEQAMEMLIGLPPDQGMHVARNMVGIEEPALLRELQALLNDPIANPPSSYAFVVPRAGETTMVKRGTGENYESATLIAHGIGGNLLLADGAAERAFRQDPANKGQETAISEISVGLSRLTFSFLNTVDLDFALGIRKDQRLASLRKFLVKLWDHCASGAEPATDDFIAELTDEYERYASEWKDIDYKLKQRMCIAGLATGTAVVAGTFGVGTTLMGALSAMLLALAEARFGRRTSARNPLSIFLDLDRKTRGS